MTDFIIRQATSDDAPIILELVKDLAEYEKMPNGPRIGAETLANDLKRGAVQVKLAFSGERSAGYTLYYYAYSSWEGNYLV
jgi:diamine N-acetyltransferase